METDTIPDKTNERGLTPTFLLRKSQQMWTLPEDTDQFFPGRSKQPVGSTRVEWKHLASRFFENVYYGDPYWKSDEYLEKFNKQTSIEIRVESKDIKQPPGTSWRGSTSLKTDSGQSHGVAFFEYLQQIEQYCKEKNISPSDFDRRSVCLLSGVPETVPYLKNQIQQHVQIMIYETGTTEKWSNLRQLLLKEYAATHWCNALVTEWLNSFNQGSKPTSLYIAGARHWSTVMSMMLPHGQLSEPMFARLADV